MDAKKNRLSLAIGVPGIVLQCLGIFLGILLEDLNSPHAPIVGLTICWLGVGLLVVGMCYYASAKGHHWAWGFVGLLSIIGLIVLAVLSDRHDRREKLHSFQADATQIIQPGGPVYHCIVCNYILSGSTADRCPECGRPFNAQDPESMRVANERGGDWFEKEVPPWTARWSLILGLLTLLMFCIPFIGVLVPAAGVVCGHNARRQTRGNPRFKRSAGVALAGLIASYIGLAVSLASTIYLMIVIINDQ